MLACSTFIFAAFASIMCSLIVVSFLVIHETCIETASITIGHIRKLHFNYEHDKRYEPHYEKTGFLHMQKQTAQ